MIYKNTLNIFIICVSLVLNSCSPQINTSLTVVTNYKKIGINEKNLERLDSLFATALVNQWSTQAAVFVAKNGSIFYKKNFGFKNREGKMLLTANDEFRLGTLTNPILALTALALIDAGKLSLDDKVSKFLPEFANAQVVNTFNAKDTSYTTLPATNPITIKNLLNQTSGIGGDLSSTITMIYNNNSTFLSSTNNMSLTQSAKYLATMPSSFNPNTAFNEGFGYNVLAAILEKASGLTLDSVVSKTILNPLGMSNTYFNLPASKANRQVIMYSETSSQQLQRSPTGKQNFISQLGNFGLFTTTTDYAKFLQMVLNKGIFNNQQIISSNNIAMATANQIGNLTAGNYQYGFGFTLANQNALQNGAKPSKLSGKSNFNTFFWIDTSRNIIAILFTQVYQSHHGNQLLNDFEKIVNEITDKK